MIKEHFYKKLAIEILTMQLMREHNKNGHSERFYKIKSILEDYEKI